MVKYLVKKGANVNHTDEFGQTALHYAVYVGKPRMVRKTTAESYITPAKDSVGLGRGHQHCINFRTYSCLPSLQKEGRFSDEFV
jgi:ankyrin repeat protein